MHDPHPDNLEMMTLAEAAAKVHSSVTVNTLRKARRDGRLWAVKVGRNYLTNRQAIEEFLQCPDNESPRASTSERMRGNGSSETETGCSGQALALASVERLKRHSLTTSPADSRKRGAVLPIRAN
ncbi:hypothetical protein DL1_11330 [Thioclava dalianensis]|uniref:Helix-turn-helix domain-containing protein n=1 Tax=Thioclava dalianensis TaxID=1185766 RepID=A0A074TA09_9RHOB|nr:hypothetical protein DL1_11330 [Thioclava dalianensis]